MPVWKVEKNRNIGQGRLTKEPQSHSGTLLHYSVVNEEPGGVQAVASNTEMPKPHCLQGLFREFLKNTNPWVTPQT